MSNTPSVADGVKTLPELYAALPGHHYEPLWTMSGALTPEPRTHMVPFVWHYEDVRAFLIRAGDLISAEEADRRVLAMKNPGTAEHEIARSTDNLWAAVQLVLPGEIAPPHRHSPAALRYIIEGRGGYTLVDGQRVEMHEGDFLVTPSWSWHEHGHDGDGPMLWLDGLDLPLVQSMHAMFADFDGEPVPHVAIYGAALRSGALSPSWASASHSPTLVWSLKDVEASFAELRDEPGSPYDDLILEYQDPGTNGAVMPTMAAEIQLLRAGVRTEAHRHTHSVVYHVARGAGWTLVGGERFDWRRGDTFAIPTWAEHSHVNSGDDDAMLFSFNDRPALDRLGLLRERPSSTGPA